MFFHFLLAIRTAAAEPAPEAVDWYARLDAETHRPRFAASSPAQDPEAEVDRLQTRLAEVRSAQGEIQRDIDQWRLSPSYRADRIAESEAALRSAHERAADASALLRAKATSPVVQALYAWSTNPSPTATETLRTLAVSRGLETEVAWLLDAAGWEQAASRSLEARRQAVVQGATPFEQRQAALEVESGALTVQLQAAWADVARQRSSAGPTERAAWISDLSTLDALEQEANTNLTPAPSRGQYCGLYLASAAARIVAGAPGADRRLEQAAVAFGGCSSEALRYTDVPGFEIHWAVALTRVATHDVVTIHVPAGFGEFHVDGAQAGSLVDSSYRLLAGPHRIDVIGLDGRTASITEVLGADREVALVPDGESVDIYAVDPEEPPETVVVVQRSAEGPPAPPPAPIGAPTLSATGKASLSLGAAWTRFDAAQHYDVYGARVGVHAPLVTGDHLALSAGVDVDVEWGEHTLRYTDTWSGSVWLDALAGLRLGTADEWAPGGVSFGLRVGAGTVLPASAAAFELGPSLQWSLPDSRLGIEADGGASFTVWRDGAQLPQPTFHVSASWRL